jgi:hypothetical protein
LRFSRLREEARRNYVRKVAELAVQHFITNDRVNVAGLVLAGSAELKTDLSGSDLFDPRLLAKVVKIVDVSYGGENGFNQVGTLQVPADPRPSNSQQTPWQMSSLSRKRDLSKNTLTKSLSTQANTALVSPTRSKR